MIKVISEFECGKLYYNHCIKMSPIQQECKMHYHDVFEILFIKCDGAVYVIEDRKFSLQKNSLVFTRPQCPHFVQVDCLPSYERYNLLFPREMLPEEILSKIPGDLHTLNLNDNQVAIQLFEKMDYYCCYLQGEELGLALQALLLEVMISLLIEVNTVMGRARAGKHPLTERALDYIDEYLASIQSVEQICTDLSLSKSYLYQLFMNDLHMTPKQYIMQRRLNLARREILSGAKATSVYSLFGFADYSAFFRAYKRYFGYSPNQTHHSAPGTYLL